jgi:hypothetical protein
MPTQRQLDDLAAEYKQAKRLVGQAQTIITQSHEIARTVTGKFGPTTAHGLFNAMEELRNNLNRAYAIITAAKPDTPAADGN